LREREKQEYKKQKERTEKERIMSKPKLVFVLGALVATATVVVAASPHFLRCSASGVNTDGTVNACFKIAGLGDSQSLTVTASATADAVYGCLNHGQQCPNAANKVNVQADVSASGDFTSGKNGQITGCLTIDPPPTTLTCPNGQDLVLVSVTYTDVKVTAPEAGECDTSPATFAANFFPNCP
jgi:hypothetical protein